MTTWHGLPTEQNTAGRLSEVDLARRQRSTESLEVRMQTVGPVVADIPIPKRKVLHIGLTASLRELKVGESRWIPSNSANANTLALRAIGKGKFVARSEHGGSRVWRTK